MYIQSRTKSKKSNDHLIINVIDYFIETWKKKAKECTHSDFIKKKLVPRSDKCLRKTKPQPITYTLSLPQKFTTSKILYNKRKLNELPNFILKLDDNQKKLQYFKEHILFNYKFMIAKAKLKSIFFLNQFYNLLLSIYGERMESGSNLSQNNGLVNDLLVILYVFLENQIQIEQYPDALGLHITSRLAQFTNSSNEIAIFLQEFKKSMENTALVATYNFLPFDSNFKTTVSYQKTSINRLIYCLEIPYVFLLTNYSLYLMNYRDQSHLGMLNLKRVLEDDVHEPTDNKLDSFYLSVLPIDDLKDKISILTDALQSDDSLSISSDTSYTDFKIRIAFKSKPNSQNLSINELDGFIIIFYSNILKCVNFTTNSLFEYECPYDIENVFILSSRHVLIFYENCLKIMDIIVRTKVYESHFETNIETVDANFNSYIVYLPEYTKNNDSIICVTLTNGNIEVYKYLKEGTVLCLLCVIPSTGFTILSLKLDEKFFIENLYKNRNNNERSTDMPDTMSMGSCGGTNCKFENVVIKFAVLLSNNQMFIYSIDTLGINYSFKCDQVTIPFRIRNIMTQSASIIDFRGNVIFFDSGIQDPSTAIAESFFIYNLGKFLSLSCRKQTIFFFKNIRYSYEMIN